MPLHFCVISVLRSALRPKLLVLPTHTDNPSICPRNTRYSDEIAKSTRKLVDTTISRVVV